MNTSWQAAIPSLPQGFDDMLKRTVKIPRNPNRLDSTFDEYTLDLRPLFVVHEGSVDFILSHLPAWWATINTMAWRASTFAKVWRNKAVANAIMKYGCSPALAKSDYIHEDHDYVVWEAQAEWLERMSKALGDVSLKLIQTYSANMRRQFQAGMSPPTT